VVEEYEVVEVHYILSPLVPFDADMEPETYSILPPLPNHIRWLGFSFIWESCFFRPSY